MSGSPENSNSQSPVNHWFQLPFFRARFPIYTVPLALLALCLISYGINLSKLGVHFDDWTLVWVTHFLGPLEFKSAFLVDRPLLGWLYVVTNSLLGENPLVWQIFGVFVRWLSCVALWWALRGLWPRRSIEVTGIAFLFAVYPGFVSIHIPYTRAHHILILALTLFSIGAMNWAIRLSKAFWPLYVTSIITSALALFSMEYYFGLESLRPLFLWMILSEQIAPFRKRLQWVVLYYLPYGLVLLSFLTWRLLTPTPRGEITILDNIQTNPVTGLLETLKMVLQDLFKASALAWGKAFAPGNLLADYDAGVILRYALIVVGAALLTIFFLARLEPSSPQPSESVSRRRWALQPILLGAMALLLGGIPVWVTNLHLDLAFPWDRFTISMMFGASLLLFGLLELLIWKQWQLLLLTGVIVGLGAGFHFQVTLSIRRDWQSQKDFFWQLAWRAPGLQSGTAVLVSDLPFTYSNGYSLTAPLNWMYAPQSDSYEMPYVFYDARLYFTAADLQTSAGKQGLPIDAENRMLYFRGSTSKAIYVLFRPSGCVKVIDPAKDQYLPEKPPLFRELLPLSDLNLIDPNSGEPAHPPEYFFGSEPDPSWCYYFEKADLARQLGDWQQVVDLGNKVLSKSSKLSPKDTSELIPFIIGYGHKGDWKKAFVLTNRVYNADKKLRLMLCNTWGTLKQQVSLDSQGRSSFENIQQELQCGLQ